MGVKADHSRRNRVVVQQAGRSPCVFGGDDIDLAQDAHGPECYVFEITDGGRDHVQRAGHREGQADYCTIAGCALTEWSSRAPA
jgi:hypothetical protein